VEEGDSGRLLLTFPFLLPSSEEQGVAEWTEIVLSPEIHGKVIGFSPIHVPINSDRLSELLVVTEGGLYALQPKMWAH